MRAAFLRTRVSGRLRGFPQGTPTPGVFWNCRFCGTLSPMILELQILKRLQAYFLELQIPKDLANRDAESKGVAAGVRAAAGHTFSDLQIPQGLARRRDPLSRRSVPAKPSGAQRTCRDANCATRPPRRTRSGCLSSFSVTAKRSTSDAKRDRSTRCARSGLASFVGCSIFKEQAPRAGRARGNYKP